MAQKYLFCEFQLQEELKGKRTEMSSHSQDYINVNKFTGFKVKTQTKTVTVFQKSMINRNGLSCLLEMFQFSWGSHYRSFMGAFEKTIEQSTENATAGET